MKFLRNLLASVIGFFIALFLLFFVFFIVSVIMGDQNAVVVKSNSVLELDLSKPVKDYAPKDPTVISEMLNLNNKNLGLNAVINAIENAKTDDKIKGISIKTTAIGAGIAQTQAIRDKVEEFKKSGKFVYAYNDFYTQKNYYLSSVADSLFLNPLGAIDFKGLSAEILYYKKFQEKYGVKMEVIRHGKYKSAVEPYLSDKMSDANREQITSFLKSIWSKMLEDIGENRKISIEKLNQIADDSNGRNAVIAKQHNLIDQSIYEDTYNEKLNSIAKTKTNIISLSDYIKSGKGKISSKATDKIAVIYAQGNIMYAKGNEDIIGQEMINEAIRKASKDDKVKAIVLRVNSPGGSSLASELIWRELELAKKKKPLVVSMGNLAASGGYYIACNANKIIAEPTTITGSIGVFGAVPNAYELSQNIGINAEQVATNSSANYSFFEPMNEKFYNLTKEGVEQVYTTFVNRVATGRNMTFEQVNEVAQGRVWTGKEALEKGLVDKLGGLQDAINEAAKLAKIDSYKIRNLPIYKKDLDDYKLNLFSNISKEEVLKEALGDENYRLYYNFHQMKNLKGIQARMPFVFDIK